MNYSFLFTKCYYITGDQREGAQSLPVSIPLSLLQRDRATPNVQPQGQQNLPPEDEAMNEGCCTWQ